MSNAAQNTEEKTQQVGATRVLRVTEQQSKHERTSNGRVNDSCQIHLYKLRMTLTTAARICPQEKHMPAQSRHANKHTRAFHNQIPSSYVERFTLRKHLECGKCLNPHAYLLVSDVKIFNLQENQISNAFTSLACNPYKYSM